MEFIADLHIHSHYSMATSKDANPEGLAKAAVEKGLDVIGTGDFTHRGWREELKEKLTEAEDGLYKLKNGPEVRFVITGEVSSIYKKNGKTRKVHNVVVLPDLESAERLSERLEKVGNLHSDGRPILGLDSRDLFELALEVCPDVIFIPAHIWTPHFSLFGAKSGFDTIEECFEDLIDHIFALETGLSSDPAMNWRLSALDRFALVSNSDAHSPNNLAREANVIRGELSFAGLRKALQEKNLTTIEFFPEEGKYHLDGHRNCKVRLEPEETLALGGRCPVCNRPVTVGVLHRVVELADRPKGARPSCARPFESLVPLRQILADAYEVGEKSKKVEVAYQELIRSFGPELEILRKVPIEQLERQGGPLVATAIARMREGKVEAQGGFDGEYGVIKIIPPELRAEILGQGTLFKIEQPSAPEKEKKKLLPAETSLSLREEAAATEEILNLQQREAVGAEGGPVAVLAGPGTGKTHTLIYRIAHLVTEKGVRPGEITAVTFTNKAAEELRKRLEGLLGKEAAQEFTVGTFHSIALSLLGSQGQLPLLLDEIDSREVLAEATGKKGRELRKLAQQISLAKAKGEVPEEIAAHYHSYNACLVRYNAMDYDDILLRALELSRDDLLPVWRERFRFLCVDEFQDLNRIQYQLVQAWAGSGEGLFVIGDPDQAIYGFRGAEKSFFNQLQRDYPTTRLFVLNQNYRSSATILEAASSVISHNPDRYPLKLVAARPGGAAIRHLRVATQKAEGIAIAKEIQKLVGGMEMLSAHGQGGIAPDNENSYSFADIAVCFRTGEQANELEKCLVHAGIPYRLVGKKSILESSPAREAISLLHYLANPQDEFHLKQVLKSHLSPAEWEKLHLTSESLAEQMAVFPWGKKLLELRHSHLGKPVAEILASWFEEVPPDDGLEMLMKTGETQLDKLLRRLALLTDGDVEKKNYQPQAVTLLTLHAAKGLEFPVVFIAGVEEGLLPLGEALEEERSLFYVGITRAKEQLILLSVRNRLGLPRKPSRFLGEIPRKLLKYEEIIPQVGSRQLSLF